MANESKHITHRLDYATFRSMLGTMYCWGWATGIVVYYNIYLSIIAGIAFAIFAGLFLVVLICFVRSDDKWYMLRFIVRFLGIAVAYPVLCVVILFCVSLDYFVPTEIVIIYKKSFPRQLLDQILLFLLSLTAFIGITISIYFLRDKIKTEDLPIENF